MRRWFTTSGTFQANQLFVDVGTLLGAQGGRLVLQTAAFALVARGLGAEGLGATAVLLGIANILRPISGFGLHVLLVREVARDQSRLGGLLRLGLPAYVLGGVGMGGIVIWVAVPFLKLGLSGWLVAVLLIGELVLGGLYSLLSSSWQALGQFRRQALWLLSLPALRLAFLLWLYLRGDLRLPTYVGAYALSLLVIVGGGYILRTRSRDGSPVTLPKAPWSEVRQALPFGLAMMSLGLLPEIDRLFLPRLAGLDAAGQYVAGIKVISFAALPLGSLLGVLLPRIFRDTAAGTATAWRTTCAVWRTSLPASLVLAAGLVLCAPLASWLVGSADYPEVPIIIRLGAGLLILQGLHLPAGDVLGGCGLARYRALAHAAGAVVVGVLCWLAIPAWGWRGSLVAAYAGHLSLVVLLVGRLVALRGPAAAER